MQAGCDNAYVLPGLPPATDSPKVLCCFVAGCCAALSLEARMRCRTPPALLPAAPTNSPTFLDTP